MTWRAAIATGLRPSLDFRGRSSRAEYLPFLVAAATSLTALIWMAATLLPPDWTAPAIWTAIAVYYVPVTSAGVRRLHDAGFPGHLMLRPLAPLAALALACAVIGWAAVSTPVGGTALWAGVLLAPRLVLAIAAVAALFTLIATAVTFSDTASRLILPSRKPPL